MILTTSSVQVNKYVLHSTTINTNHKDLKRGVVIHVDLQRRAFHTETLQVHKPRGGSISTTFECVSVCARAHAHADVKLVYLFPLI